VVELHTGLHDQSNYPIPNLLETLCTESVLMGSQSDASRIGGGRDEYLEGLMSPARYRHLCPHDIDMVVGGLPSAG